MGKGDELKGQIFITDVSIAFIVLIISLVFFTIIIIENHGKLVNDYVCFRKQASLMDASQLLISQPFDKRGLAEKSFNNIRHHSISSESIFLMSLKSDEDIKKDLALSGKWGLSISLLDGRKLLSKGNITGISSKRIALCDGEECYLSVWGEC